VRVKLIMIMKIMIMVVVVRVVSATESVYVMSMYNSLCAAFRYRTFSVYVESNVEFRGHDSDAAGPTLTARQHVSCSTSVTSLFSSLIKHFSL
jgi:hypothetical protein